MHKRILLVPTAFAAFILADPASAATCSGTYQQCLDLGVNNNYGIVGLGGSINVNSGPIVGGVLVGRNEVTTSSGGGNGGIDVVSTDGTAAQSPSGALFGTLQNGVGSYVNVTTALTLSAMQTANAVSDYAAGLTPSSTFSSLTGTQSFTGNGGLNVFDITGNMSNVALTLTGTATDYFVFNVLGTLSTNQAMTLVGAIDPNKILFNLLGSSGNIFQTSGGNSLYGTYLAVNGGDFQFSSLDLFGRLVNTDGFNDSGTATVGGKIQFVSNSSLTAPATPAVPEPATWAMMLMGFAAVGFSIRRSQKQSPSLRQLA